VLFQNCVFPHFNTTISELNINCPNLANTQARWNRERRSHDDLKMYCQKEKTLRFEFENIIAYIRPG